MVAALTLVTRHVVIDDALAAWSEAFGVDRLAYRGHVYRVFNFSRALAGAGADNDPLLAVASAFHDIGIWSDATFDYLAPSAARAADYLTAQRPELDCAAVRRLIALHHRLRRCAPEAGALAEAFRRADLVDLSFGALRFGLPRGFVREARAAFPNAGFHRCLLSAAARWTLRHPTRPLPMLKW